MFETRKFCHQFFFKVQHNPEKAFSCVELEVLVVQAVMSFFFDLGYIIFFTFF